MEQKSGKLTMDLILTIAEWRVKHIQGLDKINLKWKRNSGVSINRIRKKFTLESKLKYWTNWKYIGA